MKSDIKTHTTSKASPDADDQEISRLNSYAVFPELQYEVEQKNKITTAMFRQALVQRKVQNTDFQDKILAMMLQNKTGVQLALADIINSLFIDNRLSLAMNKKYTLSMEVANEHNVSLIFKADWESTADQSAILGVSAIINITPDMVAISSLEMTQLADTPFADDVFKVIEDNQQNIFEKILSYVKQLFGYNHELRLEETTKEDEGLTTRLT